MPGNLVFKPIQMTFDKGSQFHDPYLVASIGDTSVRSHRGKFVGNNSLVWDKDLNKLELRTNFEPKIHLMVRDADKKEPNDLIGDITVDLDVFETKEQSTEWYDIYDKNKIIGKIQIEGCYQRDKGQGIQGMVGDVAKPQFIQSTDFKSANHNTKF